MTMETYQKSAVYEKMNHLVESIVSLSSNINDSEIIQLRFFLNQIAKSVPLSVEESLTKERYYEKRISMLKATSSLDEAKVYLSLIESFGYGKTSHIKNQVDEFNELLSKSIY